MTGTCWNAPELSACTGCIGNTTPSTLGETPPVSALIAPTMLATGTARRQAAAAASVPVQPSMSVAMPTPVASDAASVGSDEA